MTGKKLYGRWADVAPEVVHIPDTYSRKPVGTPIRAELRSLDGTLLGHVWTDGHDAAGFVAAEQAGPAGVAAGAYVWTLHKGLYERGVPASEVLDPALYQPTYRLVTT